MRPRQNNLFNTSGSGYRKGSLVTSGNGSIKIMRKGSENKRDQDTSKFAFVGGSTREEKQLPQISRSNLIKQNKFIDEKREAKAKVFEQDLTSTYKNSHDRNKNKKL